MMSEGEAGWDERLRAGDAAAAEEIFARYAHRLVRVAQQHLSHQLAGRVDGEDVVQSALRTFFRRSERGDFRIDSSAQIWRLLVRITLLKARAQARFHTADKRDVRAEAPPAVDAGFLGAVTGEPGPADAAALADQIEALLRGLPPLYGEVLQRRFAGQPVADVARDLGVSRQTVHRMLNLLQERLSEAGSVPRPPRGA